MSFISGMPVASAAAKRVVTDTDGNSIEFLRVEMILEEVEFERAGATDACRFDDDDSESDDDCEEVERGPFVVDLPLGGASPFTAFSASLPVGQWSEVEFEVEPLDDDDALANSTNVPEDESIYVEGIWRPAGGAEAPFTWTSDVDSEQEVDFDPPIEVTSDQSVNITFRVGIDGWFRGPNGSLIDPRTVDDDDDLEDLIEENIEASIEGFRDDDRDGDDDDDDDDDDDSGDGDDDDDDDDDENDDE
ncbi:hypothetical protein [Longibacter salinarum]|nr:hypothetical protein [Longibacter salinarum]